MHCTVQSSAQLSSELHITWWLWWLSFILFPLSSAAEHRVSRARALGSAGCLSVATRRCEPRRTQSQSQSQRRLAHFAKPTPLVNDALVYSTRTYYILYTFPRAATRASPLLPSSHLSLDRSSSSSSSSFFFYQCIIIIVAECSTLFFKRRSQTFCEPLLVSLYI